MTEVRISIGRLSLVGFDVDVAEAGVVRRAVETELGRLLSAGELPASLAAGRTSARLSRRPLQIQASRDAHHLGAQVGQALYRGLGGRAA